MLAQVSTMESEQDQQVQVDLVYKNLADVQTQLFINSIDSVQVPDGIVNEKEFIVEWVKNSDRALYAAIKKKLEENKEKWTMPKSQIKCATCGTEDSVTVNLDQSNFFVTA
jgi:hypothetical protein